MGDPGPGFETVFGVALSRRAPELKPWRIKPPADIREKGQLESIWKYLDCNICDFVTVLGPTSIFRCIHKHVYNMLANIYL